MATKYCLVTLSSKWPQVPCPRVVGGEGCRLLPLQRAKLLTGVGASCVFSVETVLPG